MAKKDENTEELSYTDRIYNEIEKDYGEGVLTSGSDLVNTKQQIIPISPSLDIVTSGGLLEGSWLGIVGAPKSGKTNLALTIAATAQKKEYGSRQIFYGNVEGRISKMHLSGIKGLNTQRPHFNLIRSVKGKVLTSQEHLRIYETILKTCPRCVLIIDSISSLCDEKESTGGVGTETRGGGAKLFSQFLRCMNNIVPIQDSIVIGITHLICNTSGWGAKFQERGARMWEYQRDYSLIVSSCKPWLSGKTEIGKTTTWLCKCSKLGPPGMSIDSYLRYGLGVDTLYECITLGIGCGLIKPAGSWFTLTFMQKHLDLLGVTEWNEDSQRKVKAQGGEGLYGMLNANPEWAKLLEKYVVEMGTGLVGGGISD